MGNKLAKDFKEMKLGHGHLTAANSGRNAIVPESVVLDAALTIAVQKDSKNKSIQFYDVETQKRLFVTATTKSDTMGSVTKDARGNVLFVTKAPSKSTRIIFKASDSFERELSSEPSSIDEEHDELSPVAKVDIDFVASCVTAFLSVKYRKRSNKLGSISGSINSASQTTASVGEPDFVDVYKAVKIPTVKFGSVIVDMRGQVVAKSAQEGKEPLPTINVAPGVDASAVVALACMVNGDM